jgi:hypothetical protein
VIHIPRLVDTQSVMGANTFFMYDNSYEQND